MEAKSVVKMEVKDLPYYHRVGALRGNTYIKLGELKKSGNGNNAYVEERQCEGHICRVLSPETAVNGAMVVREDGTVWKIYLSNFISWDLIEIIKKQEVAK